MNTVDKRISGLVPQHYKEYAPRFIAFLEKYYEWLHRDSGLTDEEIDILKNDSSWLNPNIDAFISTGSPSNIDKNAEVNNLRLAILELSNIIPPGRASADLMRDYLLEQESLLIQASNGHEFIDSEFTPLEAFDDNKHFINGWFKLTGFDRPDRDRINTLNSIDQVLMLSLLKHIYAIKGTDMSIKLFFNMFFGEQVDVYHPKFDIAVLDDNFIPDSNSVMRDDQIYQEYSYIILVNNEVSSYMELFDAIYRKLVHPSGFRVELKKVA